MIKKLKSEMLKKIFLSIFLVLLIFSKSIACEILNVPIGTPVNTAVETFDFLTKYNEESYEEGDAILYKEYANEFCEQGEFKNTELEIVIYSSKIAAIRLVSPIVDQSIEVYRFTKNFIKDPGDKTQNKNWKGYVDLSIGDLNIWYSKLNKKGLPHEVLTITSSEMSNWISGEHLIEDRM